MYYIRTYPLSIITIIVIWYLSFFTPPQTELNNVPFIDKIVHIISVPLKWDELNN